MTNDQREIRRKLRILEHAAASSDVSRTCRYFGIGRASFYRWRKAYQMHGEAGLVCRDAGKPFRRSRRRGHAADPATGVIPSADRWLNTEM